MRADQIERLREVEEKLADLFIDEANPDQWPGKDDRAERYRCKRDAAETAMLLARTQALMLTPEPGGDPDERAATQAKIDKRVERAALEAAEAVQQAVTRAKARAGNARSGQ